MYNIEIVCLVCDRVKIVWKMSDGNKESVRASVVTLARKLSAVRGYSILEIPATLSFVDNLDREEE